MIRNGKIVALCVAVLFAALQLVSSAAGITLITWGSALPTNCGYGNIAIKTSATAGVYWCSTPGTPGTWSLIGGSTATVSNTGTLTANQVILGNGGADIKALGSAGTSTQVLHGNASGAPSFGAVNLANDVTGIVGSSNGGAGSVSGILQANGSGTVSAVTVGSGLTFSSGTLSSSGGSSTASGGGSILLVASLTASTSASLAFTTRNATGQSGAIFQSDFDAYYVVVDHLVPATNDTTLQLTVSTNGGSTWESTNYLLNYHYVSASATHGAGNLTGTTSYFYLADHLSSTASNAGTSGNYTLYNPLSTSGHKILNGVETNYNASDGQFYTVTAGGRFASTTAVNAIKFAMSSGNIASGTIYVYGLCKTSCASASTYSANNGRITTESGVPVSTSDRTAQSTIYWTPFKGNRISLLVSSVWTEHACGETALALSGLTSGNNYDVFMYSNTGACALELSAAWTNDTTRADAITTQDGVYVKSSATTRRLVGTIRTTGTTTTEDSQAKRFVWSVDNQRPRPTSNPAETTDTWTYSGSTLRQANNNAANQFEFVQGLSDQPIEATVVASMGNSNVAATSTVGIGLDSTSALASAAATARAYPNAAQASSSASWRGYASVGYHFVAWLEASNGNSTTFNGDAGLPGVMQSGIVGTVIN